MCGLAAAFTSAPANREKMTLSYFLERLIYIIITLLLISAIIFFVTMVLPGNAAVMILGEYATPESLAALEKELGLSRPVYVQYFSWIAGILEGDFGKSLSMAQPIAPLLLFRLKNSAILAAFSLLVVTLTAIPLGVWASLRQNSTADRAIQVTSYLGISIPEFATGTLLILLFAGPAFQLFPAGGFVPFSESPIRALHHLILPTLTLIIVLIAHIMRQTRSEMIEVLHANYVRTARLKGLPEWIVIYKHALRNALLPTVTVLATDVGYLMGSVVVVEEVFAYPGLGRLIIYSIVNRDIPLLQATTLLVASIYALSNFAADLAYAWLNPRIRYR
jgi:peptide/nickel transport system permease protein